MIKYIRLKRIFYSFPKLDLSILPTMDLPAEYQNTRVPEDNSTNNFLIFGALGGACAACLILGIIIHNFVSTKKKIRHENRIEIPLQMTPQGNCITYEILSKLLIFIPRDRFHD